MFSRKLYFLVSYIANSAIFSACVCALTVLRVRVPRACRVCSTTSVHPADAAFRQTTPILRTRCAVLFFSLFPGLCPRGKDSSELSRADCLRHKLHDFFNNTRSTLFSGNGITLGHGQKRILTPVGVAWKCFLESIRNCTEFEPNHRVNLSRESGSTHISSLPLWVLIGFLRGLMQELLEQVEEPPPVCHSACDIYG